MTTIGRCWTVIIISLSLLAAGHTYAKASTPTASEVTFVAIGNPGFLTIDGKGGKLLSLDMVKEKGVLRGEAVADLSHFESGLELRDKHMHQKYLETSKYPSAKLTFSGIHGKFLGKLTLKNVTQEVTGFYTLEGKKLKAHFKIYLKDYLGEVPGYMGTTVGEQVRIQVEATIP